MILICCLKKNKLRVWIFFLGSNFVGDDFYQHQTLPLSFQICNKTFCTVFCNFISSNKSSYLSVSSPLFSVFWIRKNFILIQINNIYNNFFTLPYIFHFIIRLLQKSWLTPPNPTPQDLLIPLLLKRIDLDPEEQEPTINPPSQRVLRIPV